MIDRYLLRYFLAVVDQGNFSRAAAYCNVSQPTLSVGIAKLEQALGARLFTRSNQRIEITSAGTRFLAHARRIEREFNLALRAMDVAVDAPTFRLGLLGSVSDDIIAAALGDSRGSSNGHRRPLELVYGNERELAGHLARGRIDIALTLVGRGGDRFVERPIVEEGYALAMAATHPLGERTEIAAEELADEVMIVRRHCEALSDTSRHFTERGVRPHFALRSTNDDRVLRMVAAGVGITVMPQSHRFPGVSRARLTGFALRRTVGWAHAPDAEASIADDDGLLGMIAARLRESGTPAP
jgi:DNA-binding transcriptional LysR family regulator